jgi:hypothetical protein
LREKVRLRSSLLLLSTCKIDKPFPPFTPILPPPFRIPSQTFPFPSPSLTPTQLDQHLSPPGESAKDLLAARERQKKEAKRRKAKRSGKHAGLVSGGSEVEEEYGTKDEEGKAQKKGTGGKKIVEEIDEEWWDDFAAEDNSFVPEMEDRRARIEEPWKYRQDRS